MTQGLPSRHSERAATPKPPAQRMRSTHPRYRRQPASAESGSQYLWAYAGAIIQTTRDRKAVSPERPPRLQAAQEISASTHRRGQYPVHVGQPVLTSDSFNFEVKGRVNHLEPNCRDRRQGTLKPHNEATDPYCNGALASTRLPKPTLFSRSCCLR